MKLAEKASKRKSAGNGNAPKKKLKSTKASARIICKLRRLAAFQAQLYIFTKVEKMKADVRFVLIKVHFYSNLQKCMQGTCAQLIEEVGAFCLLYNITEGDQIVELVLKPLCSGRDTLSSYTTGVHFTAENIYTFGINKKVKGRVLWAMWLTVL